MIYSCILYFRDYMYFCVRVSISVCATQSHGHSNNKLKWLNFEKTKKVKYIIKFYKD